jgi:predicted enzyme related to lactoylglutathione lyase
MEVSGLSLILNSDDPAAHFKFYTDVVGLPARPEMGEHAVDAGGVGITFDSHSEAPGQAKEPGRQIVCLFVDNIAAEESRIEAQGVKFIRKQGREPWGGIISTFVDPAGNYVQLIEYRPQEAQG